MFPAIFHPAIFIHWIGLFIMDFVCFIAVWCLIFISVDRSGIGEKEREEKGETSDAHK